VVQSGKGSTYLVNLRKENYMMLILSKTPVIYYMRNDEKELIGINKKE
jgi:hypothetical protein